MADRTLGSQLGQLALALLNATLMLAVLLVFGLWLLVGRAQTFAADTAHAAAGAIGDGITDRVATLDQVIGRLGTLERRVDDAIARAGTADGPAVAELGALRSDVQGLTANVANLAGALATLRNQPADAVTDFLYQILQGLAARLAPPASPESPT